MKHIKSIAGGIVVTGALGMAVLGIGPGVANAAPVVPGTHWAEHPWNPGPGPWGPWGGGPAWGPPPPPPYYGYGGWDGGGPCVTGPFGFVHVCA